MGLHSIDPYEVVEKVIWFVPKSIVAKTSRRDRLHNGVFKEAGRQDR